MVLILGILISVLLAVLIYLLLSNRSSMLNKKRDKDLQSAKDELLALASHQLRTPATGVKQYIGMLREGYVGKLTPEQKKFLDKAYQSNERQLRIINDMLFVARADAGDIEFNFAEVNVSELIKDVLDEQKNNINENSQKLIRKIPARPIYAQIDKVYLRMAIENVISNAAKYTETGGTITVKLRKTKSDVIFSVVDTGVGIQKKYRYMLFQKFSRIPNPLTKQVGGTGIGLYLAKKVVDAHKGRIELKSLPGDQGSKCVVVLPIKKLID